VGTLEEYQLTDVLSMLDMSSENSGLRWVSERSEQEDPYIYLTLEQADSFGAKAVYFRVFPKGDGRPPKPQVFIYEFNDLGEARQEAPTIHQNLWNSGIVPYCFIYGASEILVYNCSKPPTSTDNETFSTLPDERIKLLGDIQSELSAYSARKFDSGLFWDSGKGKCFNYDRSAYEQLLTQLHAAKKNILNSAGSDHAPLVKRLMMMLILIKYLEERKDEGGNSALIPEIFYPKFDSSNAELSDVLSSHGGLIAMLDELSSSKHFNGKIFYLSDQEKEEVTNLDLSNLRLFVEGNVKIFDSKYAVGQMSLWRLYRFNYLPIELISHIYEDFLEDEEGNKDEGVVYTPPYLVQFLVDRCMPLGEPRSQFKVLDPACGSGIFLVGAFKRLIQWWRLQNNWRRPDRTNIPELKALLKDNIHGCDVVGEAVELSYFSLSLALLDALSPKEIWGNVHFDNLKGENLFSGDFFQTLKEHRLPTDFDLVIGNPPFKANLTEWAEKVEQEAMEENSERPKVPDNQIALLFLEQSFKLISETGKSCLILPSGPVLYNSGAESFRKYLLQQARFKYIYDFTPLRQKLFKKLKKKSAKPPVVATVAETWKEDDTPLYHCIFRRTQASSEKIEFEIDHYDIHPVAYQTAIDSTKVWHANFMGGGRLQPLVQKLSSVDSLDDYLQEKKNNHGWKVGEGWIAGKKSLEVALNRTNFLSELDLLTESESKELEDLNKNHKADWITGKPLVETNNLTKNGIVKVSSCDTEYFIRHRGRNREIFEPPHVLIKESAKGDKIPVAYSDEYLTFKDKIFGIHSPKKDKAELSRLANYLGRDYNVSLIWLLSGQVFTLREGVPLKQDILSLPEPNNEFHINEVEQVLLSDILCHYRNFRIQGEKSEILLAPSGKELKAFGAWYCRILNSVYDDFKPLKPIVGKEFIAYPFVLGDKPEIEIPSSLKSVEDGLRKLLNENRVSDNLWVRRILRVYEKNVIFLYKPNQRRYWLRSIAVRDADETFMELNKQGK
jgi:hypothetical protein